MPRRSPNKGVRLKPTFIISVLNDECQAVLVSSISNFFINKISHANKWMKTKIPTCSNSALEGVRSNRFQWTPWQTASKSRSI